jgi:uncharacterized protein (DUF885 family)
MKKAFLFCVLVLMTMNAFAQPSNDYTKLLDQFFDRYFEFNPSAGTATGFHQYDTKLEDYSQAGIDKQVAFGHEFLKKFDRLDASKMSMEDRDDLELVKSSIHSGLFELETIRQWQQEEKDTKFLRLRLGQLQDALLRNARFIVGLKMHTGQMTFEQAADFFVKEGYQTPAVAERETKRGTSDPTYLMYTLGKLQIMQLREDYKKKLGPKFSLQEFHDEFMKKGFPPVKIIRREMLGNDSPTL